MATEDWRARIVIDPNIHHGVPCIRGTRVPISVLIESPMARGVAALVAVIAVSLTIPSVLAQVPYISHGLFNECTPMSVSVSVENPHLRREIIDAGTNIRNMLFFEGLHDSTSTESILSLTVTGGTPYDFALVLTFGKMLHNPQSGLNAIGIVWVRARSKWGSPKVGAEALGMPRNFIHLYQETNERACKE